jgi:hypothetical protein
MTPLEFLLSLIQLFEIGETPINEAEQGPECGWCHFPVRECICEASEMAQEGKVN